MQLKTKLLSSIAALIVMQSGYSRPANSVFLDVDGKPVPADVLLMLSRGDGLTLQQKKAADTDTKSAEKTANKKQRPGKPSFKSTPELERELLEALKVGKTARARQLINMGVAVDYKNSLGETPVSIAVRKAWASMVLELIERGADIRQKGPKGVTLLHDASARGYVDVAKLLIKNGLDPATRTDKRWTALHVAARYGHWQLVDQYIRMGVNPNIRNTDGKTALDLARQLRHLGVIRILAPVTSAIPYDPLLHKPASKKRKKGKKRSKRKS